MRTVAAIGGVLLLCALPAHAAPPPSWEDVQAEVGERLRARDVGEWAREIERTPVPDDPKELLLRLAVLLRAGHLQGLDPAFDALGRLPAPIQRDEASGVAALLLVRGEEDLARRLFERAPHVQPSYAEWLDHWAASAPTDEIDAWLAARARADPDAWFGTRLRFLASKGSQARLLAETAAAVRANPADRAAVWRHVETAATLKPIPDVAWLVEAARPRLAVEAADLGTRLTPLWPKVAAAFLARALEMPFTEEDAAELRRCTVILGGVGLERQFRGSVKHSLMKACLAAGEPAKAQALLVELTAAYPEGIPPAGLALQAGEVQGASGARVVEGRLREAQTAKEGDPGYWLSRAEYFAGRGERAEADGAYERALSLVGETGREAGTPGPGPRRIQLVAAFVGWLRRSDRATDGVALLRRELGAAEPASPYAAALVQELLDWAGERGDLLRADDDLLWRYLAGHDPWDRGVERLFLSMTSPVADDAFWDRAERLVKGADPSRSRVLGWVMTRRGASRRGVPLLADALARSTDPEQREESAFTLFEAYLDLDDVVNAEALWPRARARLGWREEPEWLARLASAAAHGGRRADALRLWAARANLDRGDDRGLDVLAKAGLRADLRAFYERMAASDPGSASPRRMISRLDAPR